MIGYDIVAFILIIAYWDNYFHVFDAKDIRSVRKIAQSSKGQAVCRLDYLPQSYIKNEKALPTVCERRPAEPFMVVIRLYYAPERQKFVLFSISGVDQARFL